MRKTALFLSAIMLMAICSACGTKPALPESSRGGESVVESVESKPVSSETFSSNLVSSKISSKPASSKKSSSQSMGNKVSSSKGTSSMYKSIDEVPPMVLEGESVPFIQKDGLGRLIHSSSYQTIVKSQEQLLALYHEFESQETKEKYNADFFKENALVLVHRPLESISYSQRLDTLIKKDGKIFVGMVKALPSDRNGNVSNKPLIKPWDCILEVKQADVAGIDTVEVIVEEQKILGK